MKKYVYILTFGIILGSCGGSDTPPPSPPTPINNAPTVPTLVYPTNNLLCIENVLNFDWNASSDPDGDVITYQVQVAQDMGFSQLVHTVTESSTLRTLSLEKGIAYYWRVRATDSKGLSSPYSSINQFYTEGTGVSNYLPFTPELISPISNEIVQTSTSTLQWTANDVDTDDILSYDVYFGTANPPSTKIASNQNETSLEVSLVSSQNYFWQIIVKDNNGGETIGQIWSFTTD
ncbi:hypothetical protein Lupro_08930 [Lutibacter profundi]|uniref:Fibronectin type-III domain-containing protein n=1 Tax=Lutibacter profundi TaxID=1622118 RepID=A0A0X8G7B4_9FLAO|nr:hypothetical protein [Lutibacter profundi]AMC11375.1 hypothetical protein Lupro_08930 [Lutibacter profundi]